MKHLSRLAAALLIATALNGSAAAVESVAFILDLAAPQGNLLFLDPSRKAARSRPFKAKDVTGLLADDGLKLSRFQVLLIGPRATNSRAVSDWMRRHASDLRLFVNDGGTILVFLQHPDFWDIEPWLPPETFILRGRKDPGRPAWIDESHPLFSAPHILDEEALRTRLPVRSIGAGDFRAAKRMNIVARGSGDRPWCAETGWGAGRTVLFSWEPWFPELAERARSGRLDGESAAVRLARELIENAIAYALAAAAGRVPALSESAMVDRWDDGAHLDPAYFTPESDKALALRVNAAVDRGVAWLTAQQKEDGSWGPYGASNGTYEAGPTAIALHALLSAGVNKHKDFVEKGFNWLYHNPPSMTYEVAFTMMALDEKAAPQRERFELRRLPPEKRKAFEFQRNLSDDDARLMRFCRDRLVENVARGGTWKYCPGVGDGDISNGQYALLGLKAASRCGIKVGAEIWKDALDYFLTYQQPSGPKVVYHRFKRFEKDWTPKFYAERAESRGWQYLRGHPGDPSKVIGTHVCIGVASALICYEALAVHPHRKGSASLVEVRHAVRDGLAWLSEHWSIDHIPNGDKFYYYYYIYSLERVGVLTASRFIGAHDWYREGATYLLAKQDEIGSWTARGGEWGTPVANTAFALLFLKRSTPPPVITIGK